MELTLNLENKVSIGGRLYFTASQVMTGTQGNILRIKNGKKKQNSAYQ
jgi:hypothetical protein